MKNQIIPPANDKLREAEFFYMLVQRYQHKYEAKYFLSAFLAALYSATEHNRLYSRDVRFRDWFHKVVKPVTENSVISRLNALRNKETHHQGTDNYHVSGINFPDGLEIRPGMAIGVDFSGPTPVHFIEGASLSKVKHETVDRWVWDTPDSPDVVDLCWHGLELLRSVIRNRDEMQFVD